jgi:hypothetical protein
MFVEQKKIKMEKANRMANCTYSIIEKSVSKIVIGKAFWKSMVLPSLLYGVGVIDVEVVGGSELVQAFSMALP